VLHQGGCESDDRMGEVRAAALKWSPCIVTVEGVADVLLLNK